MCGVHSLELSGTPRYGKPVTKHRSIGLEWLVGFQHKVGKHLQDCQVQSLTDQLLVNQSRALRAMFSCFLHISMDGDSTTMPVLNNPFREEILADVQAELLLNFLRL